MTRLLLTGHDDAYTYIGELTTPLMRAYAATHSMEFRCEREYATDTHPAWQKLGQIIKAIEDGYEEVLWLDADIIVTNPEKEWKSKQSGIHISRDWGWDARAIDFSTCAFVAYPDSLKFWQEAQTRQKWEWAGYFDQSAARDVYADFAWARRMVHIYPRRMFNAVPFQAHGVVHPWQVGDFLCHLTGLGSLHRRIEVFHEVMAQI